MTMSPFREQQCVVIPCPVQNSNEENMVVLNMIEYQVVTERAAADVVMLVVQDNGKCAGHMNEVARLRLKLADVLFSLG